MVTTWLQLHVFDCGLDVPGRQERILGEYIWFDWSTPSRHRSSNPREVQQVDSQLCEWSLWLQRHFRTAMLCIETFKIFQDMWPKLVYLQNKSFFTSQTWWKCQRGRDWMHLVSKGRGGDMSVPILVLFSMFDSSMVHCGWRQHAATEGPWTKIKFVCLYLHVFAIIHWLVSAIAYCFTKHGTSYISNHHVYIMFNPAYYPYARTIHLHHQPPHPRPCRRCRRHHDPPPPPPPPRQRHRFHLHHRRRRRHHHHHHHHHDYALSNTRSYASYQHHAPFFFHNQQQAAASNFLLALPAFAFRSSRIVATLDAKPSGLLRPGAAVGSISSQCISRNSWVSAACHLLLNALSLQWNMGAITSHAWDTMGNDGYKSLVCGFDPRLPPKWLWNSQNLTTATDARQPTKEMFQYDSLAQEPFLNGQLVGFAFISRVMCWVHCRVRWDLTNSHNAANTSMNTAKFQRTCLNLFHFCAETPDGKRWPKFDQGNGKRSPKGRSSLAACNLD